MRMIGTIAGLLASALCLGAQPIETADARPNILLILSDDQRADSIGALGGNVRTPGIDRLVARGVSFNRAYCMGSNSGAVCAPSRAMIMTGRSLWRLGDKVYDLHDDIVLAPELLSEAGYQTFGTGKWHSGFRAFNRAFEGGGSIFFGGMGSHTELMVFDYNAEGAYPNNARRKLDRFSSTQFAGELIGFLSERDESRPFFAMLSFTAPHDPRTPPPPFDAIDSDSIELPANFMPEHPFDNGELIIRDEQLAATPREPAEVRRHIADYHGMIEQMDEQIGRVLDALDAAGLADSTIVIFASDHGLAIGSHGLMGKQNLYEHSMRSPLVIAGPGVEAGGRSDALVYLADIAPTVLEFAGVASPAGMEAVSVAPFARGEPAKSREFVVTAYKQVQRAITDGRWKLISYPRIDRVQLFDLATDPHEIMDLSTDPANARLIEALLDEMRREQGELGDPLASP